ncbi:MAG TPA: SIS domain-containing protein, partial [Candidatus Hydrogenedentes bacterium]|nr:SIS domain-containing protein [Candidatus Hydrogenedentota bacterium]
PDLSQVEQEILDKLEQRRPDLKPSITDLLKLHERLVKLYDNGGKLLLCGNGGSHADSIHIAGELCKSFERKRPLTQEIVSNLEGLPWSDELAENLETGLAAIPLGTSGALKTAVENDSPLRDLAFAQETLALAKPGDVLVGISTSGNAPNCIMAQSTAKAVGCTTAAFTGPHGGILAIHADIPIRTLGDSTAIVQEAHIALWHTMCLLIEAHYFPDLR